MKSKRKKNDDVPEIGTFRYGIRMHQSRGDFTQAMYERMKRKREEKRKRKIEKKMKEKEE